MNWPLTCSVAEPGDHASPSTTSRTIFHGGYTDRVGWDVEYSDEFGEWWGSLTSAEQEDVRAYVKLLAEYGPALRFPYCSGITQSGFPHMRELRIQHSGRPYRVLYAFDPRRTAILLLGGDKTGDDRWYEHAVPRADRIYADHLDQLRREGLIDG